MNPRPLWILGRYALAFVAVCVLYRIYVSWVVSGRPIEVFARVHDSSGQIVFTPVTDVVGSERRSIGEAVLRAGGWWPRTVVLSGNDTYVFCPFDRVLVLVPSIDMLALQSSGRWSESPLKYPFPGTPTKDDWAAFRVKPKPAETP